MPITSAGLDYVVSAERVPTGVPGLDDMLEGKGYYRGSSIMVSGTAGTGKSSLAAHLAPWPDLPPNRFAWVDEIPRNEMGKIQRKTLRDALIATLAQARG